MYAYVTEDPISEPPPPREHIKITGSVKRKNTERGNEEGDGKGANAFTRALGLQPSLAQFVGCDRMARAQVGMCLVHWHGEGIYVCVSLYL